MADELDLSRLAELGRLLDSGVPEIVATLLEELRRSLSAAEAALADGDLASAALAAHAARNSALMIGAQPLLDVLQALESSARADDREGASCPAPREGHLAAAVLGAGARRRRSNVIARDRTPPTRWRPRDRGLPGAVDASGARQRPDRRVRDERLGVAAVPPRQHPSARLQVADLGVAVPQTRPEARQQHPDSGRSGWVGPYLPHCAATGGRATRKHPDRSVPLGDTASLPARRCRGRRRRPRSALRRARPEAGSCAAKPRGSACGSPRSR